MASASWADGPPGSGVPVPGAKAGSTTSMSKLMNAVASPTRSRIRAAVASGPISRTSSVVRYSRPSSSRRPVQSVAVVDRTAQPDLDRVGHVDEALLDRPAHPRPVVVLLAEVAVPGVGVRVEVDDRDRAARPSRPQVRQRAGVVAADEQRDDARLDDRGDGLLDRLVAALDVARHDRDVAVVDARQDVERLHVEIGVVRAGA